MNKKLLIRIIFFSGLIIILAFISYRIFIWAKIYKGYRDQSKLAYIDRLENEYQPDQYKGEIYKIAGSGCENRIYISTDDNRDLLYLVNNCKVKKLIGRRLVIGDSLIKRENSTEVKVKSKNGNLKELELPFYY
jgi:hypothetical protein